jgi:hypothetical protein
MKSIKVATGPSPPTQLSSSHNNNATLICKGAGVMVTSSLKLRSTLRLLCRESEL